MKHIMLAGAVLSLGLMSGCAHVVPPYQESVENVTKLERGGTTKVKVGEFTADAALQSLHSRGNTFKSPYKESFSEYLHAALQLELARAGRLDPNAGIRVDAVLQKNNLDISGFDIGSLEIVAQFSVHKNGMVTYKQVKSARKEWSSSFMGAIAIPLARDAYPSVMTQLLGALFADAQFINAIR